MTPVYLDLGGDYKYMARHSNHCGSGRDKRNSNFHYFVLIRIYLFRNYQQIMRNYIPLEQINVKSNYFKCCIYDVYNFCIFSSISDYIEHGIHDLPPRKYICVWFSLSINFNQCDRYLSLQLNFNWLKKGRKLFQKWTLKMFNFSAVSISMGIAGRSPNAD